jgi:hypothetical protein
MPKEALDTVQAVEDFVAGLSVFIFREILRHFRHYFAILSGGTLLLGIAVSSYVFEPKQLLLTLVLIATLAFVLGGVFVYASLDRDEVLSRLSRGNPGQFEVNLPFLRWAFTWGVVPIATALAIRYPQTLGALSTWIGPLVNR